MAQDFPKDESLFDFLYVDRPRLVSYSAQLFDDGNHVSTRKTNSVEDRSSRSGSIGLSGVARGEVKKEEAIQNTIERQFDTSWSSILDLLRELDGRNFITELTGGAKLGQMVLFKGNIQIIDVNITQKFAPAIFEKELQSLPSANKAEKESKKRTEGQYKLTIGLLEKFPPITQLTAFNQDIQIWSTLDPSQLVINSAEISYKHGVSIPGEWTILALLDALPDNIEYPNTCRPLFSNDFGEAMRSISLGLKETMGRLSEEYGVTPLAIYRRITPKHSPVPEQ